MRRHFLGTSKGQCASWQALHLGSDLRQLAVLASGSIFLMGLEVSASPLLSYFLLIFVPSRQSCSRSRGAGLTPAFLRAPSTCILGWVKSFRHAHCACFCGSFRLQGIT